MQRILPLLAVVLAMAGCESTDPKELEMKPAGLIEFEPTTELKQVWNKNAGSGQDERYTRFIPGLDGKGNIYTVGVEGDVYALEAASGKRIWRYSTVEHPEDAGFWSRTEQVPISGGIGVSPSAVFFGTFDGRLHVLDSATGALKWQAEVSSEIAAPPAGNNDVVVANTIDGRVFAFDAETGKQRWSYDHAVPVLTLRGTASPLITSSQVILAFDNGQILSLSLADGSSQWQIRTSRPKGRTELDRIVDIDGTPVLSGGYLYAASFQGSVVAVSRGAGRVMWTKDISTAHAVAVDNGKVFISTEESRLVAFNAITGELEWENFELKRRDTGAPTVFGDFVAVTDAKGYVYLLNQSDGVLAYRFLPRVVGDGKPKDKYLHFKRGSKRPVIRSPLISSDDLLYAFTDDGRLTAYRVVE